MIVVIFLLLHYVRSEEEPATKLTNDDTINHTDISHIDQDQFLQNSDEVLKAINSKLFANRKKSNRTELLKRIEDHEAKIDQLNKVKKESIKIPMKNITFLEESSNLQSTSELVTLETENEEKPSTQPNVEEQLVNQSTNIGITSNIEKDETQSNESIDHENSQLDTFQQSIVQPNDTHIDTITQINIPELESESEESDTGSSTEAEAREVISESASEVGTKKPEKPAKFTVLSMEPREVAAKGGSKVTLRLSAEFDGIVFCRVGDSIWLGHAVNASAASCRLPPLPAGVHELSVSLEKKRWAVAGPVLSVDEASRLPRLLLGSVLIGAAVFAALAGRTLWKRGRRRRKLRKMKHAANAPLVLNRITPDDDVDLGRRRALDIL